MKRNQITMFGTRMSVVSTNSVLRFLIPNVMRKSSPSRQVSPIDALLLIRTASKARAASSLDPSLEEEPEARPGQEGVPGIGGRAPRPVHGRESPREARVRGEVRALGAGLVTRAFDPLEDVAAGVAHAERGYVARGRADRMRQVRRHDEPRGVERGTPRIRLDAPCIGIPA